MEIFVMRGLPGSGKSTHINHHRKEHNGWGKQVIVCSADDEHINQEGKYDFKPEFAQRAHLLCKRKYLNVLKEFGEEQKVTLFVDNTNTTVSELGFYMDLPPVMSETATVSIVQVHCAFQVACQRGIHKVPLVTMWKMHQHLLKEQLPPWWRCEHVFGDQ